MCSNHARFEEIKATEAMPDERYYMNCVDCIENWEKKDTKCKRWCWSTVALTVVIIAFILILCTGSSEVEVNATELE